MNRISINAEVLAQLRGNDPGVVLYLFVCTNGHKINTNDGKYFGTPLDVEELVRQLGWSRAKLYRTIKYLVEKEILVRFSILRQSYIGCLTGETRPKTMVKKVLQTQDIPESETDGGLYVNTKYLLSGTVQHRYLSKAYICSSKARKCSSNNETCPKPSASLYTNSNHTLTGSEMKNPIEKKIALLEAEMEKIHESFVGRADVIENACVPIRKEINRLRQKLVTRRNTGYRSTDYIEGGARFFTTPPSPAFEVLRHFLVAMFEKNGVDYFVPKSSVLKYLGRLKWILVELGDVAAAKAFVDWYVGNHNYKKIGYPLDLFVTAAVLNTFRATGKNYMDDMDWLNEAPK